MLKITKLNTYYGGLHILKDLNLEVRDGEMVCLIGANGAGKSTLLKAISGLLRPASGTIEFNGVVTTRMKPRQIVDQGITQVPEGRLVFAGLNPAETMQTMAQVKKIRDTGVTIFLVEHNMKAIMSTCDRIMVLNQGNKIAEGTPKEISENKEVIEAYLGKGMAEV